MPVKIYLTDNFNHLSRVAADIVISDIKTQLKKKDNYVLGLATGNSPTGLYKKLASAFNKNIIPSEKIRTFNLDEYVGLPGDNSQQRSLHKESYSYFMIAEFFGLMKKKFIETNVPWGNLINQNELIAALKNNKDMYELQGRDKGKAIVIKKNAGGILKMIKKDILDAYEKKIKKAGGIDLHIIGLGGRGHVAFHERGIPFKNNRVILVKLDDNTIENAVIDGHFKTKKESPQYAVSMGAELVFKAKTVLLLANGKRKNQPVAESLLNPSSCDIPLSYAQYYASNGGNMIYVVDKEAGKTLISRKKELIKKGYEIIK